MARDGAAAAEAVVVVILPDGGRYYLRSSTTTSGCGSTGCWPRPAQSSASAQLLADRHHGSDLPDVVLARTTDRVGEAIDTLQRFGISQLPVSEAPDGEAARGHRGFGQRTGPARSGLPQPGRSSSGRSARSWIGRCPTVDVRGVIRRGLHAPRRRQSRRAGRAGRPAGRGHHQARPSRVPGAQPKLSPSGRPRPRAAGPAGNDRHGASADGRRCDHPPMRPDDLDARLSFETLAVHAGQEPDELTGAVAPPIYQTSTYAQDGVNRPRRGYDYARTANPTRDRLQRAVAALEGGGEGIAFASGSAATAAIAELAPAGSEIVVGDDVYGGTFRYLEQVRRPNGVDARYVDLAEDADALWEAMNDRTRLIWFETPTNPLLKVIDIAAAARAIARAVRRCGRAAAARRRQYVCVAGSPAAAGSRRRHRVPLRHQVPRRPQRHGSRDRRDPGPAGRRAPSLPQNAMGGVPGPFDCFLVLRGLRTLHLRVARHVENAAAIATFLAARDDVAWVGYPGLAAGRHAHPQAILAARQMRGSAGMISFRPAAGTSGRAPRNAGSRSRESPGSSRWRNPWGASNP